MIERVDVAIVGGGPAGCAAAIALCAKGLAVVILERANEPQTCVGETLAPAGRMLLSRLGLLKRFNAANHAPSAGTLAAWGAADLYESHAITNPYGHGWHLDRASFNQMLAEAATEGGAWLLAGAHLRNCSRLDSGEWLLAWSGARQPDTLKASVVIDATGRRATIARRLGAIRKPLDGLVGIAAFMCQEGNERQYDTRTLVEASAGGWWYSAWLPDGRLIAAYMSDADLLPKGRSQIYAYWRECLVQTCYTRARTEGSRVTGMHTLDASSHRLAPAIGDGWLAIGDAALSLDPLSSQGLCNALATGLQAAAVVGARGRIDPQWAQAYEQWLDKSFDDFLHKRAVYYAREQRWPSSLFWQRRQLAAHPA